MSQGSNKSLATALVNTLNCGCAVAVVFARLMSLSRDNFLFNKNATAGRALLTLGKTGSGTSSSGACNYFFCMVGAQVSTAIVALVVIVIISVALNGNFGLLKGSLATNCTLLTVGHTGGGTGCILTCNNFFLVAECRAFISYDILFATNTSTGLGTVRSTGCVVVRYIVSIGVIKLLTYSYLTNRTGLGSGTGCIDPIMIASTSKNKGHINIFALATLMLYVNRGNLILRGNTVHGIGIYYLTVYSKNKSISALALYLEFYTLCSNLGIELGKVLPVAPVCICITGVLDTCAVIRGIATLVGTDTEVVAIAVFHSYTQINEEVVLGLFDGKIVFRYHAQGLIVTLKRHPPGVIVSRIVCGQNAVSLVAGFPSCRIAGRQIKRKLKSTVKNIGILFNNKAIYIVIPIQHQRLTVKSKHLSITEIGVNRQFNGITDCVILLICYNCAVFKSGDRKSDCILSFNENIITAFVGTLNGSGYVAVVCAGLVTQSSYNGLLYGSYTANSTLLAISLAGFGTSSRCTGNCLFGVTQSSYNGLLYGSYTANSTLLTVGHTGFGTSSSFSCYSFLGVAISLTVGGATQRAGLWGSTGCICPFMLTRLCKPITTDKAHQCQA